MQRGNPARMPGAPSLQELERFGATNFADDDAIRSKPECGAHELGERHDPRSGTHRHMVVSSTLQLDRVLEQDDPVAGGRDLFE